MSMREKRRPGRRGQGQVSAGGSTEQSLEGWEDSDEPREAVSRGQGRVGPQARNTARD